MADNDFDSVDIDDPCALLPIYKKALFELETGQAIARGKFGSDDIEFSRADMGRLTRRVAQLENECAIKQGKPRQNRRRAMRAGFR